MQMCQHRNNSSMLSEISHYGNNGSLQTNMKVEVDPEKPEAIMLYREELARHDSLRRPATLPAKQLLMLD